MTSIVGEQSPNAPAHRTPKRISLEKFYQWKPVDGFKYEWVDGKIEKTTRSMTPDQQYIALNLQDKFIPTKAFQQGDRLVVETDATLSPREVRRPDISLMTRHQIKECASGAAFLPAFAIEIISKNDNINKVREKLEAYFKSGVQVVWHIFPALKKVDVYTSPKKVVVLAENDLCSAAPAVPDFEISVNDLFKI